MLEIVLGAIVALALTGGGIAFANSATPNAIPPDPIEDDPFYRWDALFKSYGSIYNCPWWMLKAICMNESSLGQAKSVALGITNPGNIDDSTSTDGLSWGLMQVTLRTGRQFDPLITAQKLNSPDYAIKIGAQYVRYLIVMFSLDNEEFVIKSYNQGEGNSKKEMSGAPGYADEYWARYQRNKHTISERQGLT